jgi:hypothetical protein
VPLFLDQVRSNNNARITIDAGIGGTVNAFIMGSSVVTLIPTVCEAASTAEFSGGNNRATTRSLNF